MSMIPEPSPTIRSWVPILSLVISSSLTIILIYVYLNQSNTLSRQTDLQEKVAETQQEQQELQAQQAQMIESINRPVIAVEFWESHENRVNLCISNLGGLLASQIGVSVRLDPIDEFDPPETLPSPTENTINSLNRETPTEQAIENGETVRNYLLSDEVGVEFTRKVSVHPEWTENINLDLEFETAVDKLHEESIRTGLLTIHLNYFDTLTETRQSRLLWSQKISIAKNLTLQDCLEQTESDGFPMTAYTPETCVSPQNRPSI